MVVALNRGSAESGRGWGLTPAPPLTQSGIFLQGAGSYGSVGWSLWVSGVGEREGLTVRGGAGVKGLNPVRILR